MRIVLTVWLFLSSVLPWAQVSQSADLPRAAPTSTHPSTQSSVLTGAINTVYQISATTEGVVLTWQFEQIAQAAIATAPTTEQQWTALQAMPQMRMGDYWLPMFLETVLLPTDTIVTPRIDTLTSELWLRALPQAEALTPAVVDWQSFAPPTFREQQTTPTAPVFLLREGRMRGVRLGVIAISPLYIEAGVTKLALAVRATIPGARTLSAQAAGTLAAGGTTAVRDSAGDFTSFSQAPVALQPPAVGPTNPAATKDAFTLQVQAAGIQRLSGAALLDAGMGPGAVLAHLQLTQRGNSLPLEIRDSDGLLDAATEVRFYAPPAAASMQVGDRWNATTTYWLTSEPTAAAPDRPRMITRNAFPRVATLRQTAYEQGIWEENQIYESNMAGVDGDHWFGAKLESETVRPDDPASYPYKSITLTHALPLDTGSAGDSIFMLTGSARSVATHTLHVNLGDIVQPLTWSNQIFYENWQHTFTRTVQADQLDLVLIAVFEPSMIRVDKVSWQQPVQLDFQSRGAVFSGVVGLWRYQLVNTPSERTLYDITDPNAPVILQIPAGPKAQFEDGPTAHTYLLSGPGTLHTPVIAPHAAIAFTTTGGADAVYIAPVWLHDELAPLVEHRRQQGYTVQVIDVQQIYDGWSYGQVAPEAIRDFLRYVVSYWTPAPIAAILVGDSTVDPRNYSGMQDGVANVNILPAYLAPIDPWIGETACESCFAQLDGADPLDETYDPGFLVDIWLGRLSIQDEAQLQTVVDKILSYEASVTRDPAALWHQTALYVADNYIHPNGAKDPAGNFPYFSDLIINGDPTQGIGAAQAAGVISRRLYYDPSYDSRTAGDTQPWREPVASLARLRTIEEINLGPALVTYNGHGNHFLWATTDPTYDPPYLFGANDVFELTNWAQPSILLAMTCYTSQFTYISPTGYTLDERFFRHTNGGAVAVWGSAGLTVAVGHDWMQQGFHRKLWKSPPLQARLGELITAGYATLFESTPCCQDTRSVYLLLGDPLMPALIWAPKAIYLPVIVK